MRLLVAPPAFDVEDDNPYLGLLVDPDGYEIVPPMPLAYNGPKSLMTLGSSDSGKSTSLLIPNLATLRRSIICMDPKGQIAAVTANARRKMGRTIIINGFDELLDVRPDLESNGWNPLAQLDPDSDDFGSDARSIAELMIDKGSTGKGEFFETSMENLFTVFTMWERLQKGEKASLCDVRETLAELGGDDAVLANLEAMKKSELRAIRIPAKRLYKRLTDRNSQSTSIQDVIETVMKNTAFLDDPRIEYDMKVRVEDGVKFGGAVPFSKMHDEIITVYLIIPLGQLEKQAKYLRMFVKLAFAQLFRSSPRAVKLPRILFALDEFGNLGRIPEVLNALNVARDYRLQCWFFLQNLQQLKNNYAKEWTYFFSGCGAITTYETRDPQTAEEFSKILGNREVEMTTQSKSGGSMLTGFLHPGKVQLAQSTAIQIFPLIAPDDLWQLGKGHTINLIQPCPFAAKGSTPGYWELFRPDELDPNPYYHG